MSEATIGHNSKNAAGEKVLSYIERIERLEEEKKAIADDVKDVYAELKGNGYDAKAIRRIVVLRKRDADKVKEEQAVLETYLHAIGMDFLL